MTTLYEVRGAALSVRTEQEAIDFLDWCRYSMDFTDTAALVAERLGRAMHIRLGHSNKFGGGRCRCWGEGLALAGVYGNLAALEATDD